MTTYTIGRGADNDIIIDEPSISRRHAELISEPGGQYRLKDLGSSNGTHVQKDGGWETLGDAGLEIETGTSIRLGQKIVTLAVLLDLREESAGEDAAPPDEGRYAASTDTTHGPHGAEASMRTPPASNAPARPGWVVPAAAIGGGGALIVVVVLVMLMGPFGGAGRTDFVEACTIRSGSRVKCQCWGTALRRIFSKQEFDALTAAVVKRDFLTALQPNLRAKFTRIRDVTAAQCGRLAP